MLEAFYRGENVLTLQNFIKGDYWKVDEISEELRDTGDYGSYQDLVLAQVLHIIKSFGIGKVTKISVVGLSEALENMVREAVEAKPRKEEVEDATMGFLGIIDAICDLKKQSDRQREAALKKKGEFDTKAWSYYHDRVDFTLDDYSRNLEYVVSSLARFIEIEIEFTENGTEELENAIRDYLLSFSQDDYLDKKPAYRETRYYFSKQLENFVAYINKLPVINGFVNVSFEVLGEKGFEFVKVASYLERQGKIKVRNWGDENVWNIKFQNTPITVSSLVSKETKIENTDKIEILKKNLSFDETKSLLKIDEAIVKLQKNSDQYHLLRIIFENKDERSKQWFYSEIAEKFDALANLGDKKFYNAAYQINQKIARETGLKDVFITTTQSIQINPKYLK